MNKPAKDISPDGKGNADPIVRIAAPKHKWPRVPTYIHRDKSLSGCDETERECELCGLVKITVHAGGDERPYRAWRTKAGRRMKDTGLTPTCDGVGT